MTGVVQELKHVDHFTENLLVLLDLILCLLCRHVLRQLPFPLALIPTSDFHINSMSKVVRCVLLCAVSLSLVGGTLHESPLNEHVLTENLVSHDGRHIRYVTDDHSRNDHRELGSFSWVNLLCKYARTSARTIIIIIWTLSSSYVLCDSFNSPKLRWASVISHHPRAQTILVITVPAQTAARNSSHLTYIVIV